MYRVCDASTIAIINALSGKPSSSPRLKVAISDALNGKAMSRTRENWLRTQIGGDPLPTLCEVEACPDCGSVHHARCNGNNGAVIVLGEGQRVSGRRAPRRYQRISDMPVSMLAQSIRDRMVYRWDN